MKSRSYKLLVDTLWCLEIKHSELAEALDMSPTSLSARMTEKLPWSQDEMYLVCDYVNAIAKNEGETPPLPYERIHEFFPPRNKTAIIQKLKKGA